MKNKKILMIVMIIGIVIIAGFLIPKETKPSNDTRVILEHSHQTYIAPPCYQNSGATNNIQDATLEEAIDLTYDSNDSCTEDALENEKNTLVISLLKGIGVISKKWDHW